MSTKNQPLFLEQVLLISAIFHAEASSTCPVTLPADAAGFKWIGGGAAELQELGRHGWITGPSPRCIKPDPLDASFIGQGGTLEAMATKNQPLFLEQPPQPYSFGHDNKDEFGTQSYHNEQSDANNVKTVRYA
ncbi:hypothetical protein MTO96_018731 [Rhipicephalus appendiculatus]